MSLLHYEQTSPKTLDRPKRALVGVKGIRVLALETSKDAQATEILKLKTRIKKLEKKCKPSISHHKAWLRSVSILSMKKKLGKKESVSKQGRKNAKPRPTLDDSAFDNLDADGIDYMDTKEVVNKGRESKETEELNVTHDTGVLKKGGSNEEQVNVAGNIGVSTVVPEVSTVNISTASRPEVSTFTPMTPPTITSVFYNEDITLAETLVKMKNDKAKLKGVAIKEVKESDRLEISVLTLKPLPKIDPKDKGKGVLEEEHEPAKKLNKSDLDAAQLAMDKEFAIQANAELQAELERERVAAEEATHAALASEFDEIQARINADTLLAKRLQEAEREQFTVEQRAKFLHDIIAAQRKFLAEQRAVAIRNKPLTKTHKEVYSNKNQIAFVEGFWSDSDEEDDEKVKNKTCLVAQASNEVHVSLHEDAIRISLGLLLLPGSTGSSSSAQNVAFVSSESTNNTNDTRHFARECISKGNQDIRRRDAWNTGYKSKDNGRRPGKQEESKALVTLDGDGSDTEVTSCSKECEESYAKLKKLYDEQREQLGDVSIEIKAYTLALAKVEAQLVCHQKNKLAYEEKIRFMKIDLDDKTDMLTYHKKLLAEAVKEKEELKMKLENFQSSSKGLSKLLSSQMSAKDKSGLGYGDQIHEGVLSYENEVFESVFDSRSSDIEDSHVYDRFAKVEGMHAVPPLMTGNYVPPRSDFGIDDEETLESMSEPVINEPKVVNQPKVWSDAPIIEEYESDSDDKHVIKPSKEQEKPSFAFVNTVELNKQKGKGTGQGENRPVWNNVQRLNPQNKFVPTAVLTRTGRLPVNTAKHNVNSQPVSTSAARKVNDVRPIVNDKDPHKALKNKGIVDSGCSKHMTGNKAYLVEYQDYNGGPVAFGGSKGYITGKGKIRTGKLDFEDVSFVKDL
ncbi:hypothetical protein Tco_0976232 [Tanacetum coccineum]|uniref:Retrovirus-related Pol polyprotein from transposon TNT 1-94-like beta-barrel domain-containing protein n=1 Tax=Tanacetum coccineum TaxID=301880 RepID=A0ABQ5EGR6_9ASTR